MLVATNRVLSRQKFCRKKHNFVATKDHTCGNTCLSRRDKSMLVVTKVCLSRQTGFCRDKGFVAKSIILSRQKMIPVAAPGNDTGVAALPSRTAASWTAAVEKFEHDRVTYRCRSKTESRIAVGHRSSHVSLSVKD